MTAELVVIGAVALCDVMLVLAYILLERRNG